MIFGHVSIAYLSTYYVTGSAELSAVAGVITNLPDYFYYIQKDYNKLYNTLHKPHTKFTGWRLWLVYLIWLLIPPIGLHCLVDIPCHNKETGNWNALAWIGEISLTMLLIWFLIGGNSWTI